MYIYCITHGCFIRTVFWAIWLKGKLSCIFFPENGKTVDVNNLIDAIYNADKHPSVHEECLDSQGESCHSDNLGEPPLEASGFYVESVSESEDEEVQSTAEAVLLG